MLCTVPPPHTHTCAACTCASCDGMAGCTSFCPSSFEIGVTFQPLHKYTPRKVWCGRVVLRAERETSSPCLQSALKLPYVPGLPLRSTGLPAHLYLPSEPTPSSSSVQYLSYIFQHSLLIIAPPKPLCGLPCSIWRGLPRFGCSPCLGC
jgi:hypothetical protein